jgi:cell division protein FtsQ
VSKPARDSAKGAGRSAASSGLQPALRRDLGEDFAPRRRSIAANRITEDDEEFVRRRRLGGLRFRLTGGVPRSIVGRVMMGVAFLFALGATLAGMWEARAQLLKNPRLVLASSSAIQITGNHHLTRAQLLTVFGEDVDRNILTVPLEQRRAELESLPWVEHATIMRLMPNRFRVAIVERKPVAFVRQGSRIGLIDANGVLLDMASDGDAPPETHYSFPVLTGISGEEPLSTRAARIKLFTRFLADLGDKSKTVSEVDLSNPEDVKALIPDSGKDILVHFGSEDFLRRYELYEKNLPGWKREFPRLASADMRYERQVVLEMQQGVAPPTNQASGSADAAAPADAKPAAPPVQAKKLPAKLKAAPVRHLTQSFDVPSKAVPQ